MLLIDVMWLMMFESLRSVCIEINQENMQWLLWLKKQKKKCVELRRHLRIHPTLEENSFFL